MRVAVLCEYTGTVRDAFQSAGHNAISVDLVTGSSPGYHFIGDALKFARSYKPDLIIAHPPCTYLSRAQQWMVNQSPDRAQLQLAAIKFVDDIFSLDCKMIAIENPPGALSRLWRPYDQLIQPWHFGNDHFKEICLWLKNLPPLISTCYSSGRRSMSNHTNSRMSQTLKSSIRSRFFPEVAKAMASQWS